MMYAQVLLPCSDSFFCSSFAATNVGRSPLSSCRCARSDVDADAQHERHRAFLRRLPRQLLRRQLPAVPHGGRQRVQRTRHVLAGHCGHGRVHVQRRLGGSPLPVLEPVHLQQYVMLGFVLVPARTNAFLYARLRRLLFFTVETFLTEPVVSLLRQRITKKKKKIHF
jgi:hypothetical protein